MRKSVSRKRTVAAPPPPADEESAHDRLLKAATRLFCKNGINATGIDAIIEEAGTAKTTLYKLFGSKTNLVHAVLESEGRQWREWFIGAIETGGGDAQTRLARIFPALKRWFAEERFYGCPFINAVGEHDKDQKQFRTIAMKHKKVVLAHIEKLASEMGAAEPQMLAHQLALLIDGAIVAAMVSRDPTVADMAGLAAGALLGALLAWWGARFLESQLYGVGTGDLLTAALAIAALAAVAAVACWLPAHRATRIDPAVALRDE